MSATLRRRAMPFAWAVALALCLGLCLAPHGGMAVETDAGGGPANLTHDEPFAERTRARFGPMGFPNPEVLGEPLRDRARPILPHYTDTEHFRIWYDTSGVDCVYGWPDTTYLHVCKMSAERSWRTLVDTFGFRPPPPDGSDPDGGGGSDHYDIYIQDANQGQVLPGFPVLGDPPNDSTSYMMIHNDWAWFPWRTPLEMGRLIVAHEFGHSVQRAHQVSPDPWQDQAWWREASAMWGSELMCDDIDDHMLPRWAGDEGYPPPITYTLARPYEPLDLAESPYWYSRVMWSFYLSESLGDSIIPEIWYDMEDNGDGQDEIYSMTQVLAGRGVAFEDVFEEYCIWNWFTGDRDDGNHYEEGGDPGWPESTPQMVYSSFPVVGGSPPDTCRPAHLACNYVHFERGSAGDEILRITYDGPSLTSLPNAAHVMYLDNDLNSFYYGEIALSGSGNGSIDVDGFNEMSVVCLVVVNKCLETDNMDYTVGAELIPTGVPEAEVFCLSNAVPNPFTTGTEIAFTVPAGSARVELSIYDVAGRLVTTLVDGVADGGRSAVVWDGTDAGGARAASGIYFARLRAGERTAEAKMVLLR